MRLSPSDPKPADPLADEELDELPPMDGDEGDDAEPAPEELDEEPEEPGDPYDDATGEGDPLDDEELDVDGAESGWLEDANEAEGLDIGTPDLGDEDEKTDLLAGAEEQGVEDDDFAFGGDESQPGVDAGEEGFEDEDEELREEDLPRLDSGDDGEVDDAQLVDAWMIGQDEGDEARPPWGDHVWVQAGAPVQLGAGTVDAVACAGRVVIAAGQALSRVDLEGGVEPIEALGVRGGEVRAIFAEGARITLTTARGGVLVSRDGGATFAEANGWRACVARPDADGALDVVVVRGAIWGRTRGGALVRSADGGETWCAVASDRRVAALTRDESGPESEVVALAVDGVASIGRPKASAPDALDWTAIAPFPATESAESPGLSFVSRGGHVAVCAPGRGVFRAVGASWARLEGTAAGTGCALIDDDGSLVVALYSPTEERAWLALARPNEAARIVAEIGDGAEEDSDARVRALVWDDAHGVLWAAGTFGLVALHPAQRPSHA
jgi:hypothetical protein